jgi:hypothetical protein
MKKGFWVPETTAEWLLLIIVIFIAFMFVGTLFGFLPAVGSETRFSLLDTIFGG